MENITRIVQLGVCTGCGACSGCKHIRFERNKHPYPPVWMLISN